MLKLKLSRLLNKQSWQAVAAVLLLVLLVLSEAAMAKGLSFGRAPDQWRPVYLSKDGAIAFDCPNEGSGVFQISAPVGDAQETFRIVLSPDALNASLTGIVKLPAAGVSITCSNSLESSCTSTVREIRRLLLEPSNGTAQVYLFMSDNKIRLYQLHKLSAGDKRTALCKPV